MSWLWDHAFRDFLSDVVRYFFKIIIRVEFSISTTFNFFIDEQTCFQVSLASQQEFPLTSSHILTKTNKNILSFITSVSPWTSTRISFCLYNLFFCSPSTTKSCSCEWNCMDHSKHEERVNWPSESQKCYVKWFKEYSWRSNKMHIKLILWCSHWPALKWNACTVMWVHRIMMAVLVCFLLL